MTAPETARLSNISGVALARGAGRVFAVILLILAALAWFRPWADPAFFFKLRSVYELCFALLVLMPFGRIESARLWKWSALGLLVATVGFVFLSVIGVIFEYMAAAEEGERLGVPGWRGTLIFVFLLQLPAVYFERHPDALD